MISLTDSEHSLMLIRQKDTYDFNFRQGFLMLTKQRTHDFNFRTRLFNVDKAKNTYDFNCHKRSS